MKKFLLAFLLTAAVLGLLAVPALAAPIIVRGSLETAYIPAYGDGFWISGNEDGTALVFHEAGTPIPGNYDIVTEVGLGCYNLGLTQDVPMVWLLTLDVPEAGVHLSQEQAKAYWTGAALWDQYWIDLLGPLSPFNPNIGGPAYVNRWWPFLTGANGLATNLTAGKKLPRGTYTVIYTETVARRTTDLSLLYDGQKTPTHPVPEGTGVNVFTFKVGPPKK